MSQPSVALVHADPAAARALAGALSDAWPPGSAEPLFEFVGPDDEGEPASPVSLVLGDGLSGASLWSLVDRFDGPERALVLLGGPGGAPAGVVTLSSGSSPEVVASVLHALVQRQAALALVRAELRASERFQSGAMAEFKQIQDELQLAARIQRELMPRRLPRVAGLELATLFRPCGYVSGDIYDAKRLDGQRVGLLIADAVGHGVPAALMTMVLSQALTTKEVVGGAFRVVPPSEVLMRCNDALLSGTLPADRFLTAVYAVVDGATREVTIAGAGHPPAMIVGPRGARRLETDGPLLGVFPGAAFDEATDVLAPDETLIIYSDGFETAFPTITDHDEDRLARRRPTEVYLERFLTIGDRRAEGVGLAEALEELARSVDGQAGSLHQVDDITAVAVAPSAEHARRADPAPAMAA